MGVEWKRVSTAKGGVMETVTHQPIQLNNEQAELVAELLESERARLMVEIRHTDHRAYRDELRQRLDAVESLLGRCRLII